MMLAKNTQNYEFETAPEGAGLAVCVDVTPLKTRETPYGPKEEFKFVFELDPAVFGSRKNGTPFCIWSRGFTLSLSERANLTKFLTRWLGRQLTSNELHNGFDVESMLGVSAKLVVEHSEHNGSIYANIISVRPANRPLAPSGNFVRAVNREPQHTSEVLQEIGAAPRKEPVIEVTTVPDPESEPAPTHSPSPFQNKKDDWQKCIVHVGKCTGRELGDIDEECFVKLYDNWLPVAKTSPNPSFDDCQLISALETGHAAWLQAKAAEKSQLAEGDY